jgi:hypothetical protein
MRWAGHVARIEETRNAFRIFVGNLIGNVDLENQGDRRIKV